MGTEELENFENKFFNSNISTISWAEPAFYISTTGGLANGELDIPINSHNNVSDSDTVNLSGLRDTDGTIGFGIPDSAEAVAAVNYCFGIVLILIGLAGTGGNALVLYVFTRYRKLRCTGRPLMLSLASGDLIMSVLHLLPAVSSFLQKWAFGSLGCNLYAAIVGLCGIASLLTLSAIAVNRFSVIVGRPFQWLDGGKSCLFIWIVSGSLTFPPFFGWSKYGTEGLGTSCAWDYLSRDFSNRLYYMFLLVMGFFLPVSSIIISYVGILWVVCRQRPKTIVIETSGGGGGGSKSNRTIMNDLKAAKVTFTIIICFLTAWTPYAIVSMIGQFGDEDIKISPLGTALPAVFAKTSVIFNPIVYGISHPHFRSALRRLRAKQGRKKYRTTNTAMNNLNTGLNNLQIVLHPHQYAGLNGKQCSNNGLICAENKRNKNDEEATSNRNRESPIASISKPNDLLKVRSKSQENNNSDNLKPLVDDASIFPRHLLFFAQSFIEELQPTIEIQEAKRVPEENFRILEHRKSYGAIYYLRRPTTTTPPMQLKSGCMRRACSYIKASSGEDSRSLQKFSSLSENCLDILVTIDCHRSDFRTMDSWNVPVAASQLRSAHRDNEVNQA